MKMGMLIAGASVRTVNHRWRRLVVVTSGGEGTKRRSGFYPRRAQSTGWCGSCDLGSHRIGYRSYSGCF